MKHHRPAFLFAVICLYSICPTQADEPQQLKGPRLEFQVKLAGMIKPLRELDEVGRYKDNSGGRTHEVGGKKANAWDLHDMHGNVRECCLDWIADKLPGGKDPTGPTSGVGRIFLKKNQ